MSANEKQVDGNHYNEPIQVWDFVVANKIPYLEGNAIKYIARWRKKGGIADLKKAIHYIEKLIEVETPDIVLSSSRLKGIVDSIPVNPGIFTGGHHASQEQSTGQADASRSTQSGVRKEGGDSPIRRS